MKKYGKNIDIIVCSQTNKSFAEDHDTTWNFEITFEFIVHGIMLNTIGLLGLIGNVISIGVLSRPQMKSSINTLLIGLVR